MMVSAWSYLRDTLAVGAVLLTVRGVKLDGYPVAAPALGDALWAATLAAAPALAGAAWGQGARVAASVVVVLLVAGLWLDAVMWRAFTAELGPGGVRSVVLSVLAKELSEVAWVRRFFRAHVPFALLPILTAAWLLAPALPILPRCALEAAILAGLCLGATRFEVRVVLGLLAATVVLTTATERQEIAWPWLLIGPLALVPARALRRYGILRGSLVGDFLLPRPWPASTSSHATDGLSALAPRRSPPSPRAGVLAGRDILLVTVESLGRDHLAQFQAAPSGRLEVQAAPGGGPNGDRARTPFLDGLFARGVVSRAHVAPSPLTNNAHINLAWGGYRAEGPSLVTHLVASGYETGYLTTARVRYYGLGDLLARAGFRAVIDRELLGEVDDRALVGAGVDGLVAVLGWSREDASPARAPRFLHVHTNDTHVPYRVADPRFARRPPDDDRGRFLDAVEEADDTLARLVAALTERGVLADPILVVTGDHGQSFGGLGYRTHGSAVTAEQTIVPLVIAHPALAPAEVPWSSHLDVLPTLLDLVGVPCGAAFGASIFLPDRERRLVLWAGHASRTTTSCYGAIDGDEKLMIDLVTERTFAMTAEDGDVRLLRGLPRARAEARVTAAFRRLGLD